MLEVIFKCHDYAVVFKPCGMLSEGDGVPAAFAEALESENFPFEKIYTVHRLDRTTEGLMVYALNATAAAELSRIIANGELEKEYSALISLPDGFPDSGEMRDRLFFDRRRDKSFVADTARRGAKEAVLSYTVEARSEYKGKPVGAARIRLETGRTHQIRAQFGSRKAALLGDGKYGSRVNYKKAALRSVRIRFKWRGENVEYSVPPLALYAPAEV